MLSLPAAVNSFVQWIFTHQHYAYLILFLGSYFETLIITSPFVYGEIFFVGGGFLVAIGYLNLWFVLLALYLGGISGDSTNFWIGRKVGSRFFLYLNKRRVFNRIFSEKNYQRGENFFNKYGNFAVFAARLAGPLSWIMPFIAGTFNLAFDKFLEFNIPGVILGIGQFIMLGYIIGKSYSILPSLLRIYISVAVIAVLAVLFFYFRKKRKIKK